MLGPTLETQRLLLRPPAAEDFDAFAAFMADPEAALHLGGAVSRSGAWRQFAVLIGAWPLRGFSMFSIIEKSTGRWVGRGGPWMPEGWPGTEIAWGITPSAQRQGYAKEAAIATIDWAFDTLGWSQIIHCVSPANHASAATALSVGSALWQQGVVAPAPVNATFDIYGQTREAWRARRPS